jgi:hypothetical protein
MRQPILCGACGTRVPQVGGGHQPRRYCNDACKQRAYRTRQEEKKRAAMRQRWAGYRPRTQELLESALRYHEPEVVNLMLEALEAECEPEVVKSPAAGEGTARGTIVTPDRL